ncbi:MAG: D-glycero-beta-D-manno-heptose 1-phosphate adenylyltransferase [candidate division Zixibacteria bacterium]|nr:D-glycero-beta-D-manno-heptose 1-phosphate adenylyltransferase [candidate division Zixibacteria bacterium]
MGKIVSLERLIKIRDNARSEGLKVVFTNGCFDLLHLGHIDYLQKSKKSGDILIVGLNSDSSVRKIKGKGRPIQSQKDRASILAALQFVDYVCIFGDLTPIKLISRLLPDYLVKGSDWKIKDIVGKDIVESSGGKVLTIKMVKGKSTQKIIQTILKNLRKIR